MTTYRFAIGGSDADYLNAWKNILGSIPAVTPQAQVQAVALEVQVRVAILKVVHQDVHVYLIVKKSSGKVSNFSLLLLFSLLVSCYNNNMNHYQKKIVKGTVYSLLSGLIWGFVGF